MEFGTLTIEQLKGNMMYAHVVKKLTALIVVSGILLSAFAITETISNWFTLMGLILVVAGFYIALAYTRKQDEISSHIEFMQRRSQNASEKDRGIIIRR